ncbi:CRISPR-associated protein Cas4 [Tindallia californiensis]|uniref:CRISPR-associated exonuclease Cas4 n=1 Tax=Tindallia californiensis TaxID=159292 RepID=A0A1H3PPW7_9FIRM|nr:CRISPR-associated protein Cas4 [Tindallia californiensis]SDZ02991.1 CRISPR-associated exonuclease, Cas4 family [Tindallia californiensis]
METTITGTLIWYYYICSREVWLMAHQIAPEQDDPNVDMGRFIQEMAYARDKKEITLEQGNMDVIKKDKDGMLIVKEVKKSSKFIKSATMQLAHYLLGLEKIGIEAKGELAFPEERKKISVELDESLRKELRKTETAIQQLIMQPSPPKVEKIGYCRSCAYGYFCWA